MILLQKINFLFLVTVQNVLPLETFGHEWDRKNILTLNFDCNWLSTIFLLVLFIIFLFYLFDTFSYLSSTVSVLPWLSNLRLWVFLIKINPVKQIGHMKIKWCLNLFNWCVVLETQYKRRSLENDAGKERLYWSFLEFSNSCSFDCRLMDTLLKALLWPIAVNFCVI